MILLEGVTKFFGGLKALDIDRIELGNHHVEGIIGPNGAGKSTLIKAILNVDEYEVMFDHRAKRYFADDGRYMWRSRWMTVDQILAKWPNWRSQLKPIMIDPENSAYYDSATNEGTFYDNRFVDL